MFAMETNGKQFQALKKRVLNHHLVIFLPHFNQCLVPPFNEQHVLMISRGVAMLQHHPNHVY